MRAITKRDRLLPLFALLAPIAAFACIRFLSAAGPAAAPASTQALESPVPLKLTQPASPAQQRASEWLSKWSMPPSLSSPMLHEDPEPADSVPLPVASAPAAAPVIVPEFSVRTIMGTGERGMATINGKPYRLGGEPVPGWRITRIDGAAKIVEITGPDGRPLELPQGGRKH